MNQMVATGELHCWTGWLRLHCSWWWKTLPMCNSFKGVHWSEFTVIKQTRTLRCKAQARRDFLMRATHWQVGGRWGGATLSEIEWRHTGEGFFVQNDPLGESWLGC